MKKMIAMLLCLVMPLTAFGCVGAFAEATDQKVEVTDQITQSYDTDDGKTYAVPYPQNANTAAMFEMGGVTIKSVLNPGESYIFIDGAWKDFYNFKDEIISSMAADLASFGEETDGDTDEEVPDMLMALIGNISMDDITLDNFPIKAYLVPVETYNEAKANEKAD